MNKDESIKINIERLKDLKEDIKLEIEQTLAYFLGLVILISSVAVTVGLEINDILIKVVTGFAFIILIIFMYNLYFKRIITAKGNKFNELKEQIKCEYSKLLDK